MDVLQIMTNPLTQASSSSSFLRLVLALAGSHGMPQQVIATIDDVAAMLGFYDPLPRGQAAHLAGPLVTWRTDANQPTHERIVDIERLAYHQRALVAFGGAEPDHMVGTAEIVCAMGNTHKANMPKEYIEVYHWAGAHVAAALEGSSGSRLQAFKDRKWDVVSDDDVLRPGGKYHATYVQIATSIRRQAISAVDNGHENPRQVLRPLAEQLLKSHTKVREEAAREGLVALVERLDRQCETIRGMFPDLMLAEVAEPEPAEA